MKLHLGLLLFCLSFGFASLVVSPQRASTQGRTVITRCFSDPSANIIYVSRSFDSGMNGDHGMTFNGTSIAEQFTQYIKGKYDAKADSSCGQVRPDAPDPLQRFAQPGKQIVDVPDWSYVRDETAIKESFKARPGDYIQPRDGLAYDRVYCVSDSFQNTVFYTGPYPKNTNNGSDWSIGFFKDLQQKHSFKGNLDCKFETEPHSKLMLDARLAGARAGGKQVVNTGWRFDPALASAQSTAPARDEDREPASRPSTNQPPPSAKLRDFIAKEVTPALSFCQKDAAMRYAFNCGCLQLKISDYRKAHPDDTLSANPTPLATLFEGNKFDCAPCLSVSKIWAHDQAKSAGLKLPAQGDCVAEKFDAKLHATPKPTQAKQALDSAIKACR